MNGETFYNVFSLGGWPLLTRSPVGLPEVSRLACINSALAHGSAAAAYHPQAGSREWQQDWVRATLPPQTCVFKLRGKLLRSLNTHRLSFSLSLVQHVCFCSYTELMLSLCTPLMYSLFCNKAGTMNTVESIWKAQHVMPGVDVIHEISEMHELLGSFHLFHSWKQVL